MTITPETIWASRQNHPELVVKDAQVAFNLTPDQCDSLRFILMNRGVNKWLLARRRFIRLKHTVKGRLKAAIPRSREHRLLQEINTEMQSIAKMPRWVEWGTVVHHNMRANEEAIIIKGRPC